MSCYRALFLGIIFSATLVAAPSFAASAEVKHAEKLTTAEINILGTVSAINQDEILLGTVALHKNAPRNVNELAQMMINQHSANLTMIMQLAHHYHIASLNTSGAKTFLKAGQQDLLTLGALNGNAFAHAYVNAMVSGHTGALHLIDTQLMKTATTPAIKKFMTAVRAVVAMHLMRAQEVQKELGQK